MCGIAGWVGFEVAPDAARRRVARMIDAQAHRGPDGEGLWSGDGDGDGERVVLGHRRLAVIDLSEAGAQPMHRHGLHVTYNGEIFNYLELRERLAADGAEFETDSDTEVLLAAYRRWGVDCVEHLVGMFAFALWDEAAERLVCARDRFGIKPFHYRLEERAGGGGLVFASEIGALLDGREPDPESWATYLARGVYDDGEATFWRGVRRLPPGGRLVWSPERQGEPRIDRWYDPARRVAALGVDARPEEVVEEELRARLDEAVALALRADVEVGVCLSGGLDSSLLWTLTRDARGGDAGGDEGLNAYTFECGDARYDETPWVAALLEGSATRWHVERLEAGEVPALAARAAAHQHEPWGGVPTLGMMKVFEAARRDGVVVLLDGNGMDEAWAGYDYYQRAAGVDPSLGPVQGSTSPSVRPDCLTPELLARVRRPEDDPAPAGTGSDPVRALQLRDLARTKIPRALRFGDRASMTASRELRVPFLDHRLVELGLRQPAERKIRRGPGGTVRGKALVRDATRHRLPATLGAAPKRPVQTPQREWLRGELADWTDGLIESALGAVGGAWLRPEATRAAWADYRRGGVDNSFPIWQWLSLGILLGHNHGHGAGAPVEALGRST